MTVLIVDYGMGNLASVKRALEECGASALISDSPKDLKIASHIILPGVGSFTEAMNHLEAEEWPTALKAAVYDDAIPLLGICLGMQLLAEAGHEGGFYPGLGFIPGEVVRFQSCFKGERIPHVGWNEVRPIHPHPLFECVPDSADFYFVHSFHFSNARPDTVIAKTPYCGEFVSVVGLGSVIGTQFHPEKSSRCGRRLLSNFLKLGTDLC
jgi:glutamine amidotransferase